ncbi:5'-nucleotidase C-terminal domain-containing protein [Alkaliphilus crotonatoxidans]
MRREYSKLGILSVFLVLTLLLTSLGSVMVFGAGEETVHITIVHTNDLHGRVVEADFDGMGFGKIAALVDELKEANPNTLLLDAGDTVHGLPVATMVEGESILQLMNLIGYDAMTAGNHDFNYGQERLVELEQMAQFPILAANVLKADGSNLLPPYTIKEIAGIKIAIFGLATPETLVKSHPKGVEGLTFVDPVETAKTMVDTLKDQSDIIIALGHLGIDKESVDTSIKVLEAVDGIDLFIDGHSHSILEKGLQTGNSLIVSAGEYGKYLGIVDITVENGKVVDRQARLISKEDAAGVAEKAEVMAKISEIETEQEKILSEIIGKASFHLDGERELVRKGETNLGNLLTDVFLEVTGAEIALTNGGGIRGSIAAGDITRGDIISVFPFGNSIETKRVKGADLKAMLEHGTDAYPELKGAFPHVAGMTFIIDLSRPAGDRITNIQVNGEALDLEREYLLATNDFLAAGGDGYSWLAKAPTVRKYMAMDEALIEYIQKKGVVSPQTEGRIKAVSQEIEINLPVKLEEKNDRIIYIVQPGDWLSKIAPRYGLTWEELQEINQLANPNLIFPGQEILIPIK